MRENFLPAEAKNSVPKNPEQDGSANESDFDTFTDDDLLTNYVIPKAPGEGEVFEEIPMDEALLPPKLTPEHFKVSSIVARKKDLAKSGQIVPGINDMPPEPVLRDAPLTQADYDALLIPQTFKGDGSEFKVDAIETKKQRLITELGLDLPGVKRTKVAIKNQPVISSTDFTPEKISAAKAQYFITNPGAFSIDETVVVDEVLTDNKPPTLTPITSEHFTPEAISAAKAQYFVTNPGAFPIDTEVVADEAFENNAPLDRRNFGYVRLQDTFEANERRRLGLPIKRKPEVDPTSARYRDFHLKGRIEPGLDVPTQTSSITVEIPDTTPKYTATVQEKRPTSHYIRTSNLLNPNATLLSPEDFPRYGPRAPLPTPQGMQFMEAKPSLLKRLIPKFISRLWQR